MNEAYFGNILRTVMLEWQVSPRLLADQIGVALPTLAKWLRGESHPNPESLVKIILLAGENRYELAQAIAYNRYWRIHEITQAVNPRPYNFQQVFSKIVADALISGKLSEQQRSRLFEVSEQISNHAKYPSLISKSADDPSFESDLIVLPKPKIIAVDNWRSVIDKITKDHSELYNLDWKKFEDLIGHLLEEYGWKITPMGYTKDEGIDLIAVKRVPPNVEFSMMVQCKKYRRESTVGVSVVKDVWATKWEKGFHHAMIATTSYFTKGAIQKADNWKFDLRDHNSVVALCKEYGKVVG